MQEVYGGGLLARPHAISQSPGRPSCQDLGLAVMVRQYISLELPETPSICHTVDRSTTNARHQLNLQSVNSSQMKSSPFFPQPILVTGAIAGCISKRQLTTTVVACSYSPGAVITPSRVPPGFHISTPSPQPAKTFPLSSQSIPLGLPCAGRAKSRFPVKNGAPERVITSNA